MERILWIALIASGAACAAGRQNATPVFFIANEGQAPAGVRFVAAGSGLTAWFWAGEVLFSDNGAAMRVEFVGSLAGARIEGLDRMAGRANFFTGPTEQWRRDVPLYGAIVYRALYPGIDMIYGANGRELKSEFVIAPGADPLRIRMRYPGTGEVRIAGDGSLVVPWNGKELRDAPPEIYQEVDGRRVAVEGRYGISRDGSVRFIVAGYDESRPLHIDPVLSYSTLLGGSGFDTATAVAVDATGSAYVTGYTASYDFPTVNAVQSSNAGGNDVFIAKLSSAGNALVYCTYLGGKGDDRAYGIAVDASGAAYVTGATASSNFPTRGPVQAKLAGGKNAFIAKLNAAGNALVYSTYLGGNGVDAGNGIALDPAGNAYITGDTTSYNFPATAFQRSPRGAQDAFAAKLSPTGNQLVYSTFLGGYNDDHGAAIAVDSSGAAWVTGSTYSNDLPTVNAAQRSLAGGQDAFVTRLSADGNALLFSTYLGGTGGTVAYPEAGQGIALDPQGNGYITGVTASADFPLLHALQGSRRGSTDAFVSKMDKFGTLVYSTYLGGAGVDTGNAVAVDASGGAYVAGYTFSTDLAVTNALQKTSGGDYDVFVARLNAAGDALLYLSYLGGNASDTATAVALDAAGSAYVAGWTLSNNFPTVNAFQAQNPGNYATFVTKMVFSAAPVALGVTPVSGSGAQQTFSFRYLDPNGAANLTSVAALIHTGGAWANACAVIYDRAANALRLLTDAGASPGGTITPGSGSQQNSQCVLNGSGSSVTMSGDTLTLNVALTFLPAFGGTQTVYLQASNASASSSWLCAGWWATMAPPAALGVTPASGSGTQQAFSFRYSDSNGAANISSVTALIHAGGAWANACAVIYDRAANALRLLTDTGASPAGMIAPGTGTQQNSQCVLNGGGSSVTLSGNTLTLNVSLTFLPAFSGTQTVYLQASNASASSSWLWAGSWTVIGPPVALGVTPASGSGTQQTFAFRYSDANGAANITSATALIHAGGAWTNACAVIYDRAANALRLLTDTGASPAGTITPGSGSQQNSQCVLNGSGSSVTMSGNTLTLNVALTFLPAFSGTQTVYLQATNAFASSSWLWAGWWAAMAPPVALGVTPASGAGTQQTFAFRYSDANGAANISSATALIHAGGAWTNACAVIYDRAPNTLRLLTDTGASPERTITPGSGSQQNSQCVLNGNGSSVTLSGNTLTLNVALTFLPAFNGTQTVYLQASNASAYSSWLWAGLWTVR
ncbi:MAG TPA: SBBP repeat-containing protein [Bryobacteraceae bacterium]